MSGVKALMVASALALAGCTTYAEQPSVEAAVAAPEPAPWRAVNAETGQIRDIEGLEQLAKDFPDGGSVRLRMLQPYLAAGEVEKIMDLLEWLYDRGYVFSPAAQGQIPKLLEGVDPGRIAERLRAEAEVVSNSEIIATIPAEAGLVESVLMELKTGRMAVTSVSGRAVWATAPDGSWQQVSPTGAGNLSGIVFDPTRNTIWAASGNIDGGPEEAAGFAGLIEISPTGESERRIAAPGGANLSDLHRAADGTIYASDPLGGGIYRLAPGADALEVLVAPGTFRSPQGLVTSADGRRLYVSDYRYGVAIIDLESRGVARLVADGPFILDGIDGLWRNGDELVAMQNGTSPIRITAFRLSADGMRVIGQRVIEQAHPDWTEPLSGYLGGGALYYVGNGQWDRWVAGQPAQDKPFGPTQIRRLPLDQ